MSDDPIPALAVGLNEEAKAGRRKRTVKDEVREAVDAVASGAITGAGAVAGNDGDAEQVVAGAVGGAAVAAAEVVGTDQPSGVMPDEGDGVAEMHDAIESFGDAVDRADGEDDSERNIVAERIENIGASASLDTSTLVGDLTGTMLDLFRTRPKPWDAMLESDQRIVAAALKHAAQDLVASAVALITAHGDGAFYAKLEGYANKGAFKISLTAEATRDTSDALFDCEGQMVVVRRYDPKPYSGERREVPISADQRDLGFESDASIPAEPDHPDDDSDLADGFDDDTDEADDLDDSRTHDGTSAVDD